MLWSHHPTLGAEIASLRKVFSTLFCEANPSKPKQTIYIKCHKRKRY